MSTFLILNLFIFFKKSLTFYIISIFSKTKKNEFVESGDNLKKKNSLFILYPSFQKPKKKKKEFHVESNSGDKTPTR